MLSCCDLFSAVIQWSNEISINIFQGQRSSHAEGDSLSKAERRDDSSSCSLCCSSVCVLNNQGYSVLFSFLLVIQVHGYHFGGFINTLITIPTTPFCLTLLPSLTLQVWGASMYIFFLYSSPHDLPSFLIPFLLSILSNNRLSLAFLDYSDWEEHMVFV